MGLINLEAPSAPFKLEVLDGVSFMVEPVSLRDYYVAQAVAREKLTKLEESVALCDGFGLINTSNLPDLTSDAMRDGVFKEFLCLELAVQKIKSWEGILDGDGNVAPINEETVSAVLRNVTIGLLFFDRLMAWHAEYVRAKKDSGTDANGFSNPAAVPPIVTDASATSCPAPADEGVPAENIART